MWFYFQFIYVIKKRSHTAQFRDKMPQMVQAELMAPNNTSEC